MPKVAVIGAGFVGGLSAMRICQENLAEVELLDIAKAIAAGKALDIEDAAWLLNYNPSIKASDDFSRMERFPCIGEHTGLYQVDHAIGKQLGMDAEILLLVEVFENCVGDSANAHLHRGTIRDQLGNIGGDFLCYV